MKRKRVLGLVLTVLMLLGTVSVFASNGADFTILKVDDQNKPIKGVEFDVYGKPVLTVTRPESTPEPTAEPTPEPTAEPTPEPTAEPTPEPTAEPTPEPTAEPTPEPTAEPTPEPTAEPTPEPTPEVTPEPTPTPELIDIEVEKVWDDQGDMFGVRPDDVTIQLLADGETVSGKTLTLNESNGWKGKFEGLEKQKDGVDVEYTIEELAITSYESTIEGDAASGFVVTNKPVIIIEKVYEEGAEEAIDRFMTDVPNLEIIWTDPDGVQHVETIPATDGNKYVIDPSMIVFGDDSDQMFFPPELEYYKVNLVIRELVDDVLDWDALRDGRLIGEGYTETAWLRHAVIEQAYDENGKPAGLQITSDEFKFSAVELKYKRGLATGDCLGPTSGYLQYPSETNEYNGAVYLEIDGLSIKVHNMPAKKEDQNILFGKNFPCGNAEDLQKLSGGEAKLAIFNSAGEEIASITDIAEGTRPKLLEEPLPDGEYTVREIVRFCSPEEALAQGIQAYTLLEYANFTVQNNKIVSLGNVSIVKYTVDAENMVWTTEWLEGTTVNDREIVEVTEGGLTLTVWNFQAERVGSSLSIPVEKIWEDNDDQYGVRPEEVTIELLANGESTGKTLTLNESVNWKGKFSGLSTGPEYTIRELALASYESTITGDAESGFTVTNKPVITIEKVYEDGAEEAIEAFMVSVPMLEFTWTDPDGVQHVETIEATDGNKYVIDPSMIVFGDDSDQMFFPPELEYYKVNLVIRELVDDVLDWDALRDGSLIGEGYTETAWLGHAVIEQAYDENGKPAGLQIHDMPFKFQTVELKYYRELAGGNDCGAPLGGWLQYPSETNEYNGAVYLEIDGLSIKVHNMPAKKENQNIMFGKIFPCADSSDLQKISTSARLAIFKNDELIDEIDNITLGTRAKLLEERLPDGQYTVKEEVTFCDPAEALAQGIKSYIVLESAKFTVLDNKIVSLDDISIVKWTVDDQSMVWTTEWLEGTTVNGRPIVEVTEGGLTLTVRNFDANTELQPIQQNIHVTKRWEGIDEKLDLPSVEIVLWKSVDGGVWEPVDSLELQQADYTGFVWETSFPILSPVGENTVYKIQENRVRGYTTEYSGNAESGFVVTNTKIPDGSRVFELFAVFPNIVDPPVSVEARVTKNGTPISNFIALTADPLYGNGGSYVYRATLVLAVEDDDTASYSAEMQVESTGGYVWNLIASQTDTSEEYVSILSLFNPQEQP